MAKHDELTLDDAFSDPLIDALMRADKVDRVKLREGWADLIGPLRSRTPGKGDRVLSEAPRAELPAGWEALVRDCLCGSRQGREDSTARRTGTR